jgi:GDP-L-fucose synthase|tara:strand:- start:28630 stop:29589 length:960 start_codon:yes stop_codon:yes gene_type:complete
MVTKVFVAGHNGMVGAAICRQLANSDVDIVTASRAELDLTNQGEVKSFFQSCKFDQVYLAAAKVGGIHANDTYPAEFIYENLMIQSNVIHQSFSSGVRKLLFLGSSCIYPKLAKQPMTEDQLLRGDLEPTNEPYAIAKIAGIKMCESYNRQYDVDYRSVMPTNLYGPGDNYHLENSHVIPALIRRFHEAKVRGDDEVVAWGSGLALREFLHVDDMASAALHVMNLDIMAYQQQTTPMLSHLNVGTGIDCSIKELTGTIREVVGFTGHVRWDLSKPDGAPRKLMNSSKLASLGWRPSLTLQDGLADAYRWYLDNLSLARQ